MRQYLLERFLLPAFEYFMVEELLTELVLSRNVDDQFGVDHNGPQNKNPWIFLHKRRRLW
jgi:hypothetical protein